MDTRQILTVIAIMVVFFAGLVAAAYFGQRQAGEPAAISTTRRFTAKPGTMREKAIALTTSKRSLESERSSGASADGEASRRERPLRAYSLSGPDDEQRPAPSPETRTARAALNAANPEEGMRQIMAALDMPHEPEEAAHLYAALGQLHSRADPPELARAIAAFDEAYRRTEDPAMRAAILEQQAPILAQQDSPAKALQRIEALLQESAPENLACTRLRALAGRIHEETGAMEKALAAYQQAFEDAQRRLEENPDAADTLRMTGLRLTRLLRAMGRIEEAESVATRARKILEMHAMKSADAYR